MAVKALAQIYPSYVQVVTRRRSGIGTLADLKGKRVSVGSPDSGTQVVADRMLDVAKVPRRAFKREQLGVTESARALERGQIDAFFWSGGVPTGAIEELSARTPVALVDLLRYAPRDAHALGRRLPGRDRAGRHLRDRVAGKHGVDPQLHRGRRAHGCGARPRPDDAALRLPPRDRPRARAGCDRARSACTPARRRTSAGARRPTGFAAPPDSASRARPSARRRAA